MSYIWINEFAGYSAFSIILLMTTLMILLFTSIIYHELGHLLYFKIGANKNVKTYFRFNSILNFKMIIGEKYQYDNLTDNQYIKLILSGILFGLTPILVLQFTQGHQFPYIYMIWPYLIGCWSDIKKLGEYTTND